MLTDVIIQNADEKCFQSIADIYNEYIIAGSATLEEQVYDADSVKLWADGFTDREKMFVLKRKSKVIGWGIIKKYSDREGYRTACETSVYLAGTELRKGYGTFMKLRLIEECRQLGYHHIVAKIWANNVASIEYNKRLGYTIVGTQQEIGWKNGQWVDVVIMQYLL